MAEINEFDDQLKDGLSNLGNDISPDDWDLFAEKLSVANGISPIEEPAGFDDLIRERMEGLEVNADGNFWEMMESKIDQELNTSEISDEALDNLATENLSNLYIPYNPTHWTLLSHRLEEEFNVRRKIVNYKVAEFSLMVLLLLTIVQFLPSYPAIVSEKNTIAEVPTDNLLEVNKNAISTPTSATTVIASTSANTDLNEISNANALSTIISVPTEKTIPATILSSSSEIVTITSENEMISEFENINLAIVLPSESTANIKEQTPSTLAEELPVAAIAALDHTPDWSAIGAIKKFHKKVTVRLGAMTSADINKVVTPRTNPFKDNGYQQYRLGYGGGITLDLNYEKLIFSTGLIYRRVNYYPQEEINIGGSFANGYQSHVFDAVNLNLLTIPMNLQFHINNPDKKWKLHAITGASLNVMALNHYNITVNNLGSNNPSTFNFPIPSSPDADATTPTELTREADIAGEGLFEGGSFQRNHYFTANLGLGLERFISPRWSLFIQPIYQHEILSKNIGLKRDRIHSFSIQIGAKSTFK